MGKNNNLILILVLAALGYYFFFYKPVENPLIPQTQKKPFLPWIPEPDPNCPPKPKKPLRPWLDSEGSVGAPKSGGKTSPDGTVEITCDLPVSEMKKNVGGSDGAGLCVFTSIFHAAKFQNERTLFNFQEQMRKEPGGGWPEKVDKMMSKYASGVQYVQSTEGDQEILRAALRSNRMVSVTYNGFDDFYGNRSIAHMVNLVHLDDRWAAIVDNNHIQDVVWMSNPEFMKRFNGGGSGWAVILLKAGPPMPPKN